MALTKLTSNLIEGGTGTDWVTAIQTSNFTAEAGKGYFVNTTSQVLYVNLPVGVVGMEITIQDYAGTFATNKVILNANGSEKIQGSALEGRINTNNATAVLIYQDATKGWTSQDVELNVTNISWVKPTGQGLTYDTPSPQSSQGAEAATFPPTTFTATLAGKAISGTATIAGLPSGITASQAITGSGAGNTLTVTLTGTFPATNSLNTNLTLSGLTIATVLAVDYLVVAGGGGGGAALGGGGGAGGYRATTTYGGSEAVLNLAEATNYSVTIGAGGVGGTGSNTANGRGTNGGSSIFSPLPTTNFATGGGAGGSYYPSTGTNSVGNNGGSGGGAGTSGQTANYAGGVATSGQGNDGGTSAGVSPYCSGGGGGAGATGGNSGSTFAGDGGNGLQNTITVASGTGPYYAGGGGGGAYTYSNGSTPGSGGVGGGGNGVGTSNGNGNPGTPNTGGGGGGGCYQFGNGGLGGSGIVILRYPNTKTITAGGTLIATTTTVSTDKVTTFTAGTGNIQIN